MILYNLFASCPAHIEELLGSELKQLEAGEISLTKGGAGFRCGLETMYRICLYSRLASRLFLIVSSFPVSGPEELYEGVKKINWMEHFTPNNKILCRAGGRTGELIHSGFTALKVKDAVADFFREQTGIRPGVDKERPDITIETRLTGGNAEISIDISGHDLGKRGYRFEAVEAPIRENSAAAMLLRAGWPETAAEGKSFFDPMCGSGTLCIEAALMAGNIAPGLYRKEEDYGFYRWKGHDRELWNSLVRKAKEEREKNKPGIPFIFGFDIDAGAVEVSRKNIRRAGLDSKISVVCRPIEQLRENDLPGTVPGLMAVNPPYGERLGEKTALIPLYSQLGQTMRSQFPQWKGALITSEKDLSLATGLKAVKTYQIMNGPLNCILSLFPPQESVKQKAYLSQSGEQFVNRMKKNLKTTGKWARKNGISCYRIYDADLPDYNMAIDIYENQWAVVQEYAPPAEIDPRKAERRRKEVLLNLPDILGIAPGQIHYKIRARQKGSSQYEKKGIGDQRIIAQEGPCRFYLNLTDYLDSGIFLDHRIVRERIRESAEEKSFLNLFAYTGSATVHAAAGGARKTVTVDASQTYLNWAEENMALNRFTGKKHNFIRSDVIDFLKENRESFDIILLDPPTFSNSKSRKTEFSVQDNQKELLDLVWKALAPDGVIFFSCNFRKFKMEWEPPENGSIKDITKETIPFDFSRNTAIHFCWEIRKAK